MAPMFQIVTRASTPYRLPLLGGGLLLVLLLLPIPGSGRIRNCTLDLAHGPAFAILTWIILRAAKRSAATAPSAVLAFAAFACSVGVEWLQSLVGRQASLHDVIANGFGVAAGWLLGRGRSPLQFKMVGVAAALLVLGAWDPLLELTDVAWQWWQRPQLASLETALEMRRFQSLDASIERVKGTATDGEYSLEVRLRPAIYPNVMFRWPWRDWRGYHQLEFDVHVNDQQPLELVLKVQDRLHNEEHEDRFHQRLWLQPGWNHVKTSLEEIQQAPAGRKMDMSDIALLQLFAVKLKVPRVFHVNAFRLSR